MKDDTKESDAEEYKNFENMGLVDNNLEDEEY